MKRYKATLMNTFTDLNNVRLAPEVIKDILNKQPKVPVTVNFNGIAIGRVESYSLEDNSLVAQIHIDDHNLPMIDRSYAVPGMTNVEFHIDNGVRVVDSGDMDEVSISLLPANTTLKPIKLDKENKR